jgi:hypothetical protein
MTSCNVSKVRIRSALVAMAGVALFSVQAANAKNLLTNGHFTARSSIQTVQASSCSGPSSATSWTTWINATTCAPDSGVELETDMLLALLPPQPTIPPAHLIHVKSRVLNPSLSTPILASGADDGLAQVFGAYNTGPTRALASVWVYVIHGQVGMGIGNGGDTSALYTSSTLGQWQQLIGFNASNQAPVNTLIVYSTDPGGSEFYVDDAIVCSADNLFDLEQCLLLIKTSGRAHK